MQESNQEIYLNQVDEIDLKELFISLVAKKFLIASITVFVTVLAIIYALNLAPTYRVITSFTSPDEISVTTVNKLNLTAETKDTIFSKFLTHLSSNVLQKKSLMRVII